jgi:hypothetical protein
MRIARPILMVVVVLALAAYGFDCPATSTPDAAMQCCDTMPCSHGNGHGEDCCKSMQSTHSPFVQASAPHSHVSLVLFAVLPIVSNSHSLDLSTQATLNAHSHPPPLSQSAVISPLRV